MNIKFQNIQKIVFVGAGGTGGYLIPNVLRLLSAIPTSASKVKVIICDPDIVEEKNILRQNFAPQDVGEFKAKVMAQRYGSIYNIQVEYLTDKIDFDKLIRMNLQNTLIIDTVDNNRCRAAIQRFINCGYSNSWISAGNSDKDGQVVAYYNESRYRNTMYIGRTVVDLFPDQFSDEALQAEAEQEEAANCAMNTVVNPQSLSINLMGAMIVTNLIYEWAYEKRMDYDVIFYDRFNTIDKVKVGEDVFGSNDLDDLVSEFQRAA